MKHTFLDESHSVGLKLSVVCISQYKMYLYAVNIKSNDNNIVK